MDFHFGHPGLPWTGIDDLAANGTATIYLISGNAHDFKSKILRKIRTTISDDEPFTCGVNEKIVDFFCIFVLLSLFVCYDNIRWLRALRTRFLENWD